MHSSNRRIAGLAFGVLAVLVMGFYGCTENRPTEVDVPLEYRPTSTSSVGVMNAPLQSAIFVDKVVDKREETDKIGVNQEESTPVPIYASQGKMPGDFVREAMDSELRKMGYSVSETPDAAQNTIRITLTEFWVVETGTYQTQVNANVEVLDKGGKVLWSGLASGDNSRWGKSLSVENYMQCFSDATLKMADNIINSADFQRAIRAQ